MAWNTPDAAVAAPNQVLAEESARVFMARVYRWMTAGLLVTGGVAFAIAGNPELARALWPYHIGIWIGQFGLVIALPFLTFYSDIMGLIGGAVMCYFDLGITIPAFMRQLHEAISMNTFLVGIIKAPVYAFVIGLVGCYEGLQVERNAASVGRLTTRSVVESIFLIIVLDAGFSVMFSILKI